MLRLTPSRVSLRLQASSPNPFSFFRLGVKRMPKCPFCGKEIEYLYSWYQEVSRYIVSLDESGNIQWEQDFVSSSEPLDTELCPHCDQHIPMYDDPEKFLKEEYVVLRPDDPEIEVRRGNFVIFRGKVYKIDEDVSNTDLLILRLVEDELVADIIKTSAENSKMERCPNAPSAGRR